MHAIEHQLKPKTLNSLWCLYFPMCGHAQNSAFTACSPPCVVGLQPWAHAGSPLQAKNSQKLTQPFRILTNYDICGNKACMHPDMREHLDASLVACNMPGVFPSPKHAGCRSAVAAWVTRHADGSPDIDRQHGTLIVGSMQWNQLQLP